MSRILDDFKNYIPFLAIVISLFAFGMSCLSLWFSRKQWLESNRPMVIAFIAEYGSGNLATTFHLVIKNTGNRPAYNVRMNASDQEILSLVETGIRNEDLERVQYNFKPESEIPVLSPGEQVKTAFGAVTSIPSSPYLRYLAEAQISITYHYHEQKFNELQKLKVSYREGFGGATYE